MWHVSSRSGVATLQHLLLTYLLDCLCPRGAANPSYATGTIGSATADAAGRDALCQPRACQLLHNCRTTCTTNPQQNEVMEFGHCDRRTCSELRAHVNVSSVGLRWVLLVLQHWTHSKNRPTATDEKKNSLLCSCCDFSGWYNFGKIIKIVSYFNATRHQIQLRLGLGLQRSPTSGPIGSNPALNVRHLTLKYSCSRKIICRLFADKNDRAFGLGDKCLDNFTHGVTWQHHEKQIAKKT